MIKSVLIANRGEIACRIIRTARKMGIRTIAVYSDADADAPHVKLADESVHIGPASAAESYLVHKKIIDAAKESGANAIHPGYGFLSENADFAEAVLKAKLIWVGPPPQAIRDMGLKDAAKSLMAAAGVATTPGYLGENQSLKTLKAEAKKIGYPILIKAVAGGGGKGMRRVEKASDFNDALDSCKREAKAVFGHDDVILEKWIFNPRHIEVQIFGDQHGNIIHLFERDCTLQRRHQKVIEEAPAPGMDAQTREAICAAAVNAAKAVNYVGAGTVEFIADGSAELDTNSIWFMEMNTRLQVEHPVTEMITGIDLVEWQLRIASGQSLPRTQDEITINGWAMEARLYAENPSTGFLPSIGTLDILNLPTSVRIDTGVQQGGDVSPFYDPMIAKLITHGVTREEARLDLAAACDEVSTFPVHNNAGFLARLLREGAFASASVTTGFIGENLNRLIAKPDPTDAGLAAAAKQMFQNTQTASASSSPTIWSELAGFRLSAEQDLDTHIDVDGETRDIKLSPATDHSHTLHKLENKVVLIEKGWPFAITPPVHIAEDVLNGGDGAIKSPMPGRVLAVDVSEGETVSKGQTLVTLEAMKMEHALQAPFDGVVAELAVAADQQLSEGALIMKIDPTENDE